MLALDAKPRGVLGGLSSRNGCAVPETDAGWLQFSLACIAALFGLALGTLIGFRAYAQLHGVGMGEGGLAIVVWGGIGGQVLSLAGYAYFRRFDRRRAGSTFPLASSVAVGAAAGVAMIIAGALIAIPWKWALDALGVSSPPQELVALIGQANGFGTLALTLALLAIVAPVCEELIYRGIVFRYLGSRMPFAWAVVLSSLVFAIAHFNLQSFPQLFAVGIVLTLAYRMTGSLLAPMVAHACHNSLMAALLLAVS